MGKIVERKRKKKGRPSLLDLQKRNLKEQQQQREEELRKQHQQQQQKQKKKKKLLKRTQQQKLQNPSPTPLRRSARRNPNPDSNSPHTSRDDDVEEEEENEEEQQSSSRRRREKKLKLVLKLPNSSANSALSNSGSDSEGEDGNGATTSHKRRKIEAIGGGSGEKGEKQGASTNQANSHQEDDLDDGPLTPLPDKKLLLFILDRLQKKDTYGVFADPVDLDELPDYLEVIEHPMDFSTIRKNLTNGTYHSLEQFERDVFLLSSNAMQYNAPDTIYFRQARAIQELAKKDFENLRQDSDDNEPETKVVRRGRPPTKNLKKSVGRPPFERVNSDHPETGVGTGGDKGNHSNFDVGKQNNLNKYVPADPFKRISYGSRHSEVYMNLSAEKYERADEITGSSSKGISVKQGKKQIILDESRRSTYGGPSATRQDSSVIATFRGDWKQLVPVGLHSEYGYARSLARYAARLGPIAWKVASKKIERCLPAGVKFGPGWVGEDEAGTAKRSPDEKSSSTLTHNLESRNDKLSENPQVGGSSSHQLRPDQPVRLENHPSSAVHVSQNATDSTPSPISTSSPRPTSGTVQAGSRAYRPQATNVSRTGQQNLAQKSSLLHHPVNGINGYTMPAQLGKLLGQAKPSISLNSQSSSTASMSSAAEIIHDRTLDNRKNDVTAAPISTQQDGNHSPGSGLNHNNRQPSVLGSASGSDQKSESAPPDLNVGFQSPTSPGSGRGDAVQPDLALQL